MEQPSSTVCVIGLGKIGLPLAVQYAMRGFTVLGADLNRAVVETVNRGAAPFTGEADRIRFVRRHLAGQTPLISQFPKPFNAQPSTLNPHSR